jgi:hypothetical protein
MPSSWFAFELLGSSSPTFWILAMLNMLSCAVSSNASRQVDHGGGRGRLRTCGPGFRRDEKILTAISGYCRGKRGEAESSA